MDWFALLAVDLPFIVAVQSPSHVRLFGIPWTAARQDSLSLIISWSLPKFTCIESVMPSKHLILCHPLLPLPSIFPSIRLFPMSQFLTSGGQGIGASALAISPSNEYSELMSFWIDWFDLLAFQGTTKSIFQLHSSKASVLWHSALFMVQLSIQWFNFC